MNKIYFFAIALMFSFTINAQTTIDISTIDEAYTTTVDGEFVLDVAAASATIAAPNVSYDNPFKGLTFTEAEISFDINNYNGVDSIKVLGALFSLFDAELGRMYFTNGSYLGFNVGTAGFFDANLLDYGVGVDFIQGNVWKNIKLQFTTTGFAMYVDDVLAFNQNSTDVTITKGDGFEDNYGDVLTFFQNAATLAFGAGSWWSDNTRPDGTFFDPQYSYLKNITFTPDFSNTTAINEVSISDHGKVIATEYFSVSGAKVGTNFNNLTPGIYIKRVVYSDGFFNSEKLSKSIQ